MRSSPSRFSKPSPRSASRPARRSPAAPSSWPRVAMLQVGLGVATLLSARPDRAGARPSGDGARPVRPRRRAPSGDRDGAWLADIAMIATLYPRPETAARLPSENQIQPNPAKPAQHPAKFFQGNGLDFLGFSCPKRAFSRGYRDPPGQKGFSGRASAEKAMRSHNPLCAGICRQTFMTNGSLAHLSVLRKKMFEKVLAPCQSFDLSWAVQPAPPAQLAAPRIPTPRNSTLTFGSVRSISMSHQ